MTDVAFQKCISPDCGEVYDVSEAHVTCSKCGELLDVGYDWERARIPDSWAEFERLGNLGATVWADQSYRRPTVQHYYYNSIELFDSNIYSKGSVILNMIRRILGDDAFFRGIKHYTRTHAADNVETTDLKKSFEVTTGKNLDWFFEQWVYQPGLPEITASYRYNRRSKLVTLELKQTQDAESTSLFKLPMTVIIDDGQVKRHEIFFDKEADTFTFPAEMEPLMVVVDEGFQIPKRLTFEKKTDELLYQLQNAPAPNDRIWAGRELADSRSTKLIHTALVDALENETKWYVQRQIVNTYQSMSPRNGEDELLAAYEGKDARVQRAILSALREYESDEVTEFLMNVMETEDNDYLVSSAYSSLIKLDLDKAKEKFDWAMEQESHGETIRNTALSILTKEKTDSNFSKLKEMAVYGAAPYNIRGSVFSRLTQYREDHPELLDYFAKHINDPHRWVRWTCADQVIRYGNADQFADVLEMANGEPLRGGRIASIYETLDRRLSRLKKSKDRHEAKEVEKMQKMFSEKAEEWSSN